MIYSMYINALCTNIDLYIHKHTYAHTNTYIYIKTHNNNNSSYRRNPFNLKCFIYEIKIIL
jgi:hypothetical protein